MPHKEQEREEMKTAQLAASEYAKLVARELGWPTGSRSVAEVERAYLAGWEGRKATATKLGWVR